MNEIHLVFSIIILCLSILYIIYNRGLREETIGLSKCREIEKKDNFD